MVAVTIERFKFDLWGVANLAEWDLVRFPLEVPDWRIEVEQAGKKVFETDAAKIESDLELDCLLQWKGQGVLDKVAATTLKLKAAQDVRFSAEATIDLCKLEGKQNVPLFLKSQKFGDLAVVVADPKTAGPAKVDLAGARRAYEQKAQQAVEVKAEQSMEEAFSSISSTRSYNRRGSDIDPVAKDLLSLLSQINAVAENVKPAALFVSQHGAMSVRSFVHKCDDKEVNEFVKLLGLGALPQQRLRKRLAELKAQDAEEGEDHKFSAKILIYGKRSLGALSLESALGISQEEAERTMDMGLKGMTEELARAIAAKQATQEDAENLRYVINGTALLEEDLPLQVKRDIERGRYHGGVLGPDDFDNGHRGLRLADFVKKEEALLAQLTDCEVAALRFYTSSSSRLFNSALLAGAKPHPIPATMLHLRNALKKLRAAARRVAATSAKHKSAEVQLWRGLQLPDLQFRRLMQKGATDMAIVSTTTSQAVAQSGGAQILLRCADSQAQPMGTPVAWLSMYPLEEEVLIPPQTFVQCRGAETDHRCRIVNGKIA